MASKNRRLKINPELLEIAIKIDRFKWRLGDWDIKLNPTKGYSIFNRKTSSGNIAEFYKKIDLF